MFEYVNRVPIKVQIPHPSKEYPKLKFGGEALVLEHSGNFEYPFVVITPRSTLTWSGSTF